jgi:hypothetical protein
MEIPKGPDLPQSSSSAAKRSGQFKQPAPPQMPFPIKRQPAPKPPCPPKPAPPKPAPPKPAPPKRGKKPLYFPFTTTATEPQQQLDNEMMDVTPVPSTSPPSYSTPLPDLESVCTPSSKSNPNPCPQKKNVQPRVFTFPSPSSDATPKYAIPKHSMKAEEARAIRTAKLQKKQTENRHKLHNANRNLKKDQDIHELERAEAQRARAHAEYLRFLEREEQQQREAAAIREEKEAAKRAAAQQAQREAAERAAAQQAQREAAEREAYVAKVRAEREAAERAAYVAKVRAEREAAAQAYAAEVRAAEAAKVRAEREAAAQLETEVWEGSAAAAFEAFANESDGEKEFEDWRAAYLQ